MATYIDEIRALLENVPLLLREQTAMYVAKKNDDETIQPAVWSIFQSDRRNYFWREKLTDKDGSRLTGVSLGEELAKMEGAADCPHAFWLYLTLNQLDLPCYAAPYPFSLTFTRHMKDSNDRIAQVAVYDAAGTKPPMVFAYEVTEYTKRVMKSYCGSKANQIPIDDFPKFFWRALIIKNMPADYLASKDFRQLQGLGFTRFLSATLLSAPSSVVFAQDDEALAWEKVLRECRQEL